MSADPLFAMTMRMCDALFGPVETPPANIEAAADEPVAALVAAEEAVGVEFMASRGDIIALVANEYGVSGEKALGWLTHHFGWPA